MEVGGPDVICGLPASEDENAGPVSSSFSLRTKPQLPQTNSPLSSSLTKVPFFPQFGQLSGISLLSLSVGSWAEGRPFVYPKSRERSGGGLPGRVEEDGRRPQWALVRDS